MRLSPTFWAGSLTALFSYLEMTAAHSWVEAMNVIGTNGSYVGATGYPRGFFARTESDFNDSTMVNLIPPNGRPTANQILSTDSMCKSTQEQDVQTADYPRLQAAPGAHVALLYEENGHVTLPNNQPGKPSNRGTVYIYGTTQSKSDDTLLAIHKVWNKAGTGGDKRGVLLSTQNFDDGQCYQINGNVTSKQRQAQFPVQPSIPEGGDLWCQNNLALPTDAPLNQPYTLYWVWDWPTLDTNGAVKINELYTTCMDIDIHPATQGMNEDLNLAVQGTGLQHAALPSYVSSLNQNGTYSNTAMGPASATISTIIVHQTGSSTTSTTVTTVVTPTISPASTSTPAAAADTITTTVVVVVTPSPSPSTTASPSDCQMEAAPFLGQSAVLDCYSDSHGKFKRGPEPQTSAGTRELTDRPHFTGSWTTTHTVYPSIHDTWKWTATHTVYQTVHPSITSTPKKSKKPKKKDYSGSVTKTGIESELFKRSPEPQTSAGTRELTDRPHLTGSWSTTHTVYPSIHSGLRKHKSEVFPTSTLYSVFRSKPPQPSPHKHEAVVPAWRDTSTFTSPQQPKETSGPEDKSEPVPTKTVSRRSRLFRLD